MINATDVLHLTTGTLFASYFAEFTPRQTRTVSMESKHQLGLLPVLKTKRRKPSTVSQRPEPTKSPSVLEPKFV